MAVSFGSSIRRPQANYRPADRELLTRAEAAARIGVSVSAMNQWSMRGQGPSFVRLGKSTYYAQAELVRWIAAQTKFGGGDHHD